MLPAGKVEVARRLARRSRRALSGCVVWRGAVQSRGYGCMNVGGGKIALAHRVAYFLAHGEISDALTIDHLCRNRRCVNPAHLEQVTCRENNRRGFGFSGVNARKTQCRRGHALSGDNLRVRRGHRECWTCVRASFRASYLRHREYQLAYQAARRAQKAVSS